MQAHEINDLFEQESPTGQLYVRLKELGIAVEREWWIDEQGIAYLVDLALPRKGGWLAVTFGDHPGPADGLRFEAGAEPETCLREIEARERDTPKKTLPPRERDSAGNSTSVTPHLSLFIKHE
jgi:hypothetical protein